MKLRHGGATPTTVPEVVVKPEKTAEELADHHLVLERS